jgi:hypothetical protein
MNRRNLVEERAGCTKFNSIRANTGIQMRLVLQSPLLTSLLNLLITPWSTVILEKLTGSKLVKIFPAFYGTQRFMTAFTRACHLSLS